MDAGTIPLPLNLCKVVKRCRPQAEPAAERWSREAAKAVVKLETAVWPGSEHLRTTCVFSHCKRIKGTQIVLFHLVSEVEASRICLCLETSQNHKMWLFFLIGPASEQRSFEKFLLRGAEGLICLICQGTKMILWTLSHLTGPLPH